MNFNIIKQIALFVALLLFVTACAPKKHLTEHITHVEWTPQQYLNQELVYTTFTTKAQMTYNDGKKGQDFAANIKMDKGKSLWTSITALGGLVEAARVYVTPDTVIALDKLKATAYVGGIEALSNLLKVNIDFEMFQNLIVGNPIFKAEIKEVKETENSVIITLEKDDFLQNLHYDKLTKMLKNIELSSVRHSLYCSISFDKYAPVNAKQPLAYYRSILINAGSDTYKLTMDIKKADLNLPVENKISIPLNYKVENPANQIKTNPNSGK